MQQFCNNQQKNKSLIYCTGKLSFYFFDFSNTLRVYESNDKIVLNSSTISDQYFSALLTGMKDKERFIVSFLDNGNNIIETKTMSEGSIGQTAVYPREILKYALACDCNAVILAHNHPGGSKNFSIEDKELTQRIVDIFHPLQIKVLDHIIVGGGSYSSMAEKGELPNQSRSTANYEVIQLYAASAKEKPNRYKHTYSR